MPSSTPGSSPWASDGPEGAWWRGDPVAAAARFAAVRPIEPVPPPPTFSFTPPPLSDSDRPQADLAEARADGGHTLPETLPEPESLDLVADRPEPATPAAESALAAEAGLPADAALPTEAALPTDAGLPADAALPTEAARPTDTGLPTDAALPNEDARPAEVGPPAEISQPADAGPPSAADKGGTAPAAAAPAAPDETAEALPEAAKDASAAEATAHEDGKAPAATTPDEAPADDGAAPRAAVAAEEGPAASARPAPPGDNVADEDAPAGDRAASPAAAADGSTVAARHGGAAPSPDTAADDLAETRRPTPHTHTAASPEPAADEPTEPVTADPRGTHASADPKGAPRRNPARPIEELELDLLTEPDAEATTGAKASDYRADDTAPLNVVEGDNAVTQPIAVRDVRQPTREARETVRIAVPEREREPEPEERPFWMPVQEMPRGSRRPPMRERPGRPPKAPRRPAAGLLALLVLALVATFFAWVSAEPLWLAVGHGDEGTATVTECTGDGMSQRCVGDFTAAGAGFTAERVRLLGVGDQDGEGNTVAAKMVGSDSGRAYVDAASGVIHLRWGLGMGIVLLCGLGIVWATGSLRLETKRARRQATLASIAGPMLVAVAFLAATF